MTIFDARGAENGASLTSFDLYCRLRYPSPLTWVEQNDFPESADCCNAGCLMLWGSNVPAHFFTEARNKGTKSVVVSSDRFEAAKFADLWLRPRQGANAALAMAIGHVILREFHLDEQVEYFEDYCRDSTYMPMLVRLTGKDGYYAPDRFLRASDFKDKLGEENNPEWRPVAFDYKTKEFVAPLGSVGYRWGEARDSKGRDIDLVMTSILDGDHDLAADVGFPDFGKQEQYTTDHPRVLVRKVPVRKVKLADGEALAATLFDLFVANYGLDRGLGDPNSAKSYDQDLPYTPAWAERITGVPRDQIVAVAREFARNAEKTRGRSMIILGRGLNWHYMDMNFRSIVNLLVMCGCVGGSR